MLDKTATVDQLVAEHNKLDDYIKKELKRFDDYLKPHKERKAMIEAQLLDLSNQQKWELIKTDEGTAYRSRLMNVKIEDRERFIDFCNDNWGEIGNELMLVSAQKDAVKRWLEENNVTVPGVGVSYFTRINIRRS